MHFARGWRTNIVSHGFLVRTVDHSIMASAGWLAGVLTHGLKDHAISCLLKFTKMDIPPRAQPTAWPQYAMWVSMILGGAAVHVGPKMFLQQKHHMRKSTITHLCLIESKQFCNQRSPATSVVPVMPKMQDQHKRHGLIRQVCRLKHKWFWKWWPIRWLDMAFKCIPWVWSQWLPKICSIPSIFGYRFLNTIESPSFHCYPMVFPHQSQNWSRCTWSRGRVGQTIGCHAKE